VVALLVSAWAIDEEAVHYDNGDFVIPSLAGRHTAPLTSTVVGQNGSFETVDKADRIKKYHVTYLL